MIALEATSLQPFDLRATISLKMEPLVGKTEEDLIAFVTSLDEAPFRGKQLYRAIYGNRILNIESITELSASLRERLSSLGRITDIEITHIFRSEDGTRRYLLRLEDGKEIEAVFIPEQRRD